MGQYGALWIPWEDHLTFPGNEYSSVGTYEICTGSPHGVYHNSEKYDFDCV